MSFTSQKVLLQKEKKYSESWAISQNIISNILQNILELDTLPKARYNFNLSIENQHIIKLKTYQQYQLYHVKVIDQHVPNLCGYHSLYNLLHIFESLKIGSIDKSLLKNTPNFWRFHFKCINYLTNYAYKNNLICDTWPWSLRNLRWGELERTYLKILKQYEPSIQRLLKSDDKWHVDLIDFQYQFGRMINESLQHLENLMECISNFRKFNLKNVHKIVLVMLGITNHWTGLLVHKYNDQIEFIFLDSKNEDILDMNEFDIHSLIEQTNQDRILKGKQPLNNFQQWVKINCIKDIQRSIQILIDCFVGHQEIIHIKMMDEINLFLQPWEQNVLSLIVYDEEIENFIKIIYDEETLAIFMSYFYEYGNNIYVFFRIKENLTSVPKLEQKRVSIFIKGIVHMLEAFEESKSSIPKSTTVLRVKSLFTKLQFY